MVRLPRNNKNNTNAKKTGILRLLSTQARYIKRKIESASKKLVKKEPKTLLKHQIFKKMRYIIKKM